MKRLSLLLAVLLLLSLVFPTPPVRATENLAQDIRSATTITGSGYDSFSFLFDNNTTSYKKSNGSTAIALLNPDGIGSVYLLLHKAYGSYTITDHETGISITAGTEGFLHEYIDLTAGFGYTPTAVTIYFGNGSVQLSEIYVFSEGTPPAFVQRWEAPLEGSADLLLLATHGDDDQLFFAGLLPLYAGERDLAVQVVYLTDHRSGFVDNARMHEMLNGLWAVGVEAYPVWGDFADFRIDDLQQTYDTYRYSYGTSQEELLSFVVEQIRRFRPQVIVGHDMAGEYGHGMHMVYTDLLIRALEITADESQFAASAQSYGTWDVPKTYLHLYVENPIVLDYDQPLEYFDGLTAFQATQKLGYPCHKSQQYTWFTRWLNGSNGEITKATQITTYNPCLFGLYRSTVGEDVAKNDFLENITPYQQQAADRAAAQEVMAFIDSIGTVTLDSGEAIAQAQAAWEALTDAQKALVTNKDILQSAQAAYDALLREKAEQEAADLAAAQAVTDQIEKIRLSLQAGPAIAEAKAAYAALTQRQKTLVTNFDRLQQLETEYAQLVAQEQARQEQAAQAQLDAQAQQQKALRNLILLIGLLVVLLVLSLLILRHRCKRPARRRKK